MSDPSALPHGCGSCGTPGCCAVVECGYLFQIERFTKLLQRISEWDMLDSAADGPYWRHEIASALADLESAKAEDPPHSERNV